MPQAGSLTIYSWTKSLLLANTRAYVDFYESSILPNLRDIAEQSRQSDPNSLATAVAMIEYEKALRVTGRDADAGLEAALSWSTGSDPTYRILASAVLADIGTPDALAVLKGLTADSDPSVASYAQSDLISIKDLHYFRLEIDIKPDDRDNVININSYGTVPVAILSKVGFSAPDLVVVEFLSFGSSGAEKSLEKCAPQDINKDGYVDLLCHFAIQTASFGSTDPGGILRGVLLDGTAIEGIDVINPTP